jgi:hypothetical protein
MRTRIRFTVVLGVLLATSESALAQQIEWSQTLNLPKGLNLPQGVKGDMLGIELGESYAQVKARIEAIRQETKAREDEKEYSRTRRSSGCLCRAAALSRHPMSAA